MSERPDPPVKSAEILAILKRCAHEMRTITYGELGPKVGLPPRFLGPQLGYIRDHVCRAHGRPWLAAIAVNTGTMRPGDGFVPEGMNLNADDDHWWRGMVLQVYAYDWSDVVIPD